MTALTDRLATALEQLAAKLASIQRHRPRNEAPEELTNAYVAFVFAAGFARLGRRDRATQLAAAAMTGLAASMTDDVHACLVGAFSARIDQALARRPPYAPYPEPLIKQLNALFREGRYMVDRVRESLLTLENDPSLDAIMMMSARPTPPPVVPPAELVALLAIDDPAARAAYIEERLARVSALDPEARTPLLAACFDAMLELPEDLGVSLLVQAMQLFEGQPLEVELVGEQGPLPAQAIPLADDLPPELHARALSVAARFGWGELVPDFLASLRANLASASSDVLRQVLSPCLRALRGLGLREEMAALLAEVEPLVGVERDELRLRRLGHANVRWQRRQAGLEDPRPDSGHADDGIERHDYRRPRMVHAGGIAFLGDPRGLHLLDEAHAPLKKAMQVKDRLAGPDLELIQDLALGYSHAPVSIALDRIARLAAYFPKITDELATRSHYCLSVLHFVDSLVYGITGLADDHPREGARPPR